MKFTMKKLIILTILAVLLSGQIHSLTAQAQTDSTARAAVHEEQRPAREQYNLAISIFRMIFALVVVAGLAIVVVFTLKWLQGRRVIKGQQQWISTVGYFSLGPKQHIYLVKLLNRYLLLGVTEAGINILSELSEEEAREVDSRNFTPHDNFKNVLSRQFAAIARRGAK